MGQTREIRGALNHYSGLAAEAAVIRDYVSRGGVLIDQRWRGEAGEIDLIFRFGEEFIFVEVKKSETHDRAFQALGGKQIARLWAAIEEYMGKVIGNLFANIRFDVAAVDALGQPKILENALA